MPGCSSRLLALTCCAFACLPLSTARAQRPLGGELIVAPVVTGEERTSQSDIWVMEVRFKPLRMISVELTDPATGKKRPEFVWYLAYRAFLRPLPPVGFEDRPQNVLDKPVSPPLFIPEFTLMATDTDEQKVYSDQIVPEALEAINLREKYQYGSSVSVVGPIPPAAESGAVDAQEIAGVAIWRNLDQTADRFTVFMTGFSNGIRSIEGPDGKPVLQTKTLVQKYWRPGDQFDLYELEIRPYGEAEWVYR